MASFGNRPHPTRAERSGLRPFLDGIGVFHYVNEADGRCAPVEQPLWDGKSIKFGRTVPASILNEVGTMVVGGAR